MAYATATQLREYLDANQVADDAETTALLETILDRATDIVDGALGFSFSAYGDASAKDVRAVGGEYLELPPYELGSVTSVYRVYDKGTSDEDTEEITDYVVLDDGRLYRQGGWTAGGWYRVTASWGYGPAPDAIVEVTLEVAVNIWRGRSALQWSNTYGDEGGGAVTYNRALTWAQRSIIDAVRADVFGGPVFA